MWHLRRIVVMTAPESLGIWPSHRYSVTPNDLLLELSGRPICQRIEVLFIIGAFRFEERKLLDFLFPNLQSICIFEPLPECASSLMRIAARDPRVRVFPFAISDFDGVADLHVASNGQSSSLLRFARHRTVFPDVTCTGKVTVSVLRLDSVIHRYGLRHPEMLLIDAQGAENRILSSVSIEIRKKLLLIYSETSLEEMYEGSGTLQELKEILSPEFRYLGFAPTAMAVPSHGNAVFSAAGDSRWLGTLCPSNRRDADWLLSNAQDQQNFCQRQPLLLAYLDYSFDSEFFDRFLRFQESYFSSVLSSCELDFSSYQPQQYRATVIVSTYSAEAFIAECLTDLMNQSVSDQIEVVIIDACSPENERGVIKEFQSQMTSIKYVRCPERIGVYAAWNLAVSLATGEFVLPFSTNDRLGPKACEILMTALDENPDVALVYGDTYLTDLPHQAFDSFHPSPLGMFSWPEYSFEHLLRNCGVGPHPMWRRSIHRTIGYFDERFTGLGDQAFFLMAGERFVLRHLPVTTGLYWVSPNGLSTRPGVAAVELRQIRRRFWSRYRQGLLEGRAVRVRQGEDKPPFRSNAD
jgi:FkbM family methyltransferase